MYQIQLWFKRLVRYIDLASNYFTVPTEKAILSTVPEGNGLVDFLHQLGEYLAFNFYYTPDGDVDFGKHPRVFFRDKHGDCDDYALFALWVIRRRFPAMKSYLVTCFNNIEGHAVCVVEYGGNLYHISNWGLFGGFNRLDALAASIFTDWKRLYVLTYNFTILQTIKNSEPPAVAL